jgi:hypothetical protein
MVVDIVYVFFVRDPEEKSKEKGESNDHQYQPTAIQWRKHKPMPEHEKAVQRHERR